MLYLEFTVRVQILQTLYTCNFRRVIGLGVVLMNKKYIKRIIGIVGIYDRFKKRVLLRAFVADILKP